MSTAVDPTTESPLPPIPFWETKSFWFVFFSVLAFGFRFVEGLTGWDLVDIDANGMTMLVIEAVPYILALLAYRERLKPHFAVVWRFFR